MSNTETKKIKKDKNGNKFYEITTSIKRKIKPEVLLKEVEKIQFKINQLEKQKTRVEILYNNLLTNE